MSRPSTNRSSVPEASRRTSGSSRTLLLVALGAAVVVVVAGGWYLVVSDAGHGLGLGDGGDPDLAQGPVELPAGAGDPDRRRARPGRADEADGEGDDESDIWEPGEREIHGDVFAVTPETLRKALQDNVWEEVRRQIEEMQLAGGVVPEDVVRELVRLLGEEGRRLDAVLALGMVQDAFTGNLLATTAADVTLPAEVRAAALDALAKSGQGAGVAVVRQVLESESEDTGLKRSALFALAGIGGTDGVTPLMLQLASHPDDDLTDAVLTALAKSRGGDAVLAQSLREARDGGDPSRLDLLLRVGTRMGAKAGDELRREVKAIVESPLALAGLDEDPETRDRLRSSAIYVASSMGGEALDAVLRVAENESGMLRIVAVNSLRNARGDDAARKIATVLGQATEPSARYELTVALGATGSRKATPDLVRLLDDADGAVREAASSGLVTIRDPESVPAILARVDGAKGNLALATNYLTALGQIGARSAVPKLEALLESRDEFWVGRRPWITQALTRIKDQDPDTTVLKPPADR